MARVDIDLNSEREEVVDVYRLLNDLRSKEKAILDIIDEHAELNDKVKQILKIKRGGKIAK